jgi:hypothetical protein
MDLKERAIYQLPNGRELVASLNRSNKPVLLNLSASNGAEYEFDAEGRLVHEGEVTSWKIDDLVETGRVASPALTNVLEEGLETDQEIERRRIERSGTSL